MTAAVTTESGSVSTVENGNKFWRNAQDQLHRLDGPAIEGADGTKQWYVNDQLHRLDGPAVEDADGTKEWCVNDQLHRTDGPAVEDADGTKEWYVNGKKMTEEQFNAWRAQDRQAALDDISREVRGITKPLRPAPVIRVSARPRSTAPSI